jgi:phosphoglycerate kinase
MNKRSVRSLDMSGLAGRRALVRVDYNVPLDEAGCVADTARIEATLPTLQLLLGARVRPVLLSHLGRPGGRIVPEESLRPVAGVLQQLLGAPVHFLASTDTDLALETSLSLPEGEVLLLENTRFLPGETTNDEALGERLARMGDIYVNDAFGTTHRAHASVVGAPAYLKPAVAGLLVEAELVALARVRAAPDRPFVVAFGGAKIRDKIQLMESFLARAETILIGGAMANTFFAAMGTPIGESLVEHDAVSIAADFLARAPERLVLPDDLVVGVPGQAGDGSRTVPADAIPAAMAAYDIGPRARERFSDAIARAGTFFWNGPMGWFEAAGYAEGTRAMARAAVAAAEAGAFTVVGGGDSARAIREAGLADRVSHVSTGGGASLEYLAHGTLPGLEALDDA